MKIRTRPVRTIAAAISLILCVAPFAFAQQVPASSGTTGQSVQPGPAPAGTGTVGAGSPISPATDPFNSTRPQILVVVRKHRLGADLFEISAVSPTFPGETLRNEITSFGQMLGSSPRGLIVADDPIKTATGETLHFIKASFAVDGFMSATWVRLQPLVRAFAGQQGSAKADCIDVLLSDVASNSSLLAAYSGPNPAAPAVSVYGKAYSAPLGVEYRIVLHTQDPNQIVIPDNADKAAAILTTAGSNRPSFAVLGLILLGGCLAAGYVVYNLISRGGRRAKSSSRPVHK